MTVIKKIRLSVVPTIQDENEELFNQIGDMIIDIIGDYVSNPDGESVSHIIFLLRDSGKFTVPNIESTISLLELYGFVANRVNNKTLITM